MERLTTNKDKSEMGMYELAHNSCYCKDGLSRYRDFESDIDARELTRHLLKNFADGDDAFVDDDDFDEEMLELLQYGTETIEGLIALFYRNLWGMADLREKLKEYEDLDEQGLLLRLPCKVGDTVYVLSECKNVDLVLDGTMTDCNGEPGTATGWYCPYDLNDKCPHFDCEDCEDVKNKTAVFEDIVDCIYCDETGFAFHCQNTDVYGDVGKYIFLTKQEAEQKLKEMNEHDGE